MNWFTPRIKRRLFDFKIKWNSLGIRSRLRGRNRWMSYLLRRKKRNILLFSFGRLKLVWLRRPQKNFRIPLPDAPVRVGGRISFYPRKPDLSPSPNKNFDNRPTEEVLDEICKKLENERP